MHKTADPMVFLGCTDRFERLVIRALVEQAEELRRQHNDELASRLAEVLGA